MKDILHRINKTFENRVRLGIMSALMVHTTLDFNSLKELLELTDGNLSSNLSVLEQLDYITISKVFVGKKTRTSVLCTDSGKEAFLAHLKALEDLIIKNRENEK